MTFKQWWEKIGFQAGDYKGLAEKAWNSGYDEGLKDGRENGIDIGYGIGYDDGRFHED